MTCPKCGSDNMFIDDGKGECFDCEHTWEEKCIACPSCGASGEDANFLDPTEMMMQCFECDHKWAVGIDPEQIVVAKGKDEPQEVEFIGARAKDAAYPKWLEPGMGGKVVKHFKLASGSSAPVGVKFASKTVYLHYCDIMIPTEESKQTKIEKYQLDQMLKKVEAFAKTKNVDGDMLQGALEQTMTSANENFKWVKIDDTNPKVIEIRKLIVEAKEKAEAMRAWKEKAAKQKLEKLKAKFKINADKMVEDAKNKTSEEEVLKEEGDTKSSATTPWDKAIRGLKEVCLKATAPYKPLWQISPSNKLVRTCILAFEGGSDFIEDFGFKKDTEWGTGNYEMEEDDSGRRSVPNPATINTVVYGMLDGMCEPTKKEIEGRLKMGIEWITKEWAKEGVDTENEEYEGPPPKPLAKVWGMTYDENCLQFINKAMEDARKIEAIWPEAAQEAVDAGKSEKVLLKKIKNKTYKKAIAALKELNDRLNPPDPADEPEEEKKPDKKDTKKGGKKKKKKKRKKSKVDPDP